LIEVDQSSLINLGAALHAEASSTGPEH
jgi:hypothetical protein